ncbi:TetR/AcrR family transcriptional regulator [Mycobacterium sp. E2479]|uniref:TetR/AcrR family transcriptional regulator n=1 Tax=Mycobacterium sp. E2479 TaxID=1834134 RepID=UPI0007FD2ECC|nr:TetR/AcrR family transcriptional regulator [Mycobacterium sp. E2479]OBH60273.1 TetR family transcriptional regulator [Mycobacterium sp. E2479]
MPRPRRHDPDAVLDAVEDMVARAGPTAVTIRAISAAVGVSNGAVYHTFTSRGGLMGQAWLRAGRRFLALQTSLVDEALATGGPDGPPEAVVAAANAVVVFTERYPGSSTLVLRVRREEVLGDDVPDDVADELRRLDKLLVALMVRLAIALWDRKDAAAVDAITSCVVDLPTALLLRRDRLASATARAQLHAAVRAVLAVGPPTPTNFPNGKHNSRGKT